MWTSENRMVNILIGRSYNLKSINYVFSRNNGKNDNNYDVGIDRKKN